MFTTKDGAKLIAPGRQESMHFEKTLTLSRRSVRIQRQAGQTQTGMDNSTTGLTQPRWRIEITSASSTDRKVNGQQFTCPLIHAVGFPFTTHQSTDDMKRAPLSRKEDLENIIFTKTSTINQATRQLKLTAAIDDGETTIVLPRSQALANLSEGKWKDFKIQDNLIPRS